MAWYLGGLSGVGKREVLMFKLISQFLLLVNGIPRVTLDLPFPSCAKGSNGKECPGGRHNCSTLGPQPTHPVTHRSVTRVQWSSRLHSGFWVLVVDSKWNSNTRHHHHRLLHLFSIYLCARNGTKQVSDVISFNPHLSHLPKFTGLKKSGWELRFNSRDNYVYYF